MKGMRKFFEESANVYIVRFLGGRQAPSCCMSKARATAGLLLSTGSTRRASRSSAWYARRCATRRCPRATVINTRRATAWSSPAISPARPARIPQGKLPLVLMPHGGPEARDYARHSTLGAVPRSRGYAVFQPNFRGSDGFGRKFAESGHGEWGRKMQDDISDGVEDAGRQGHRRSRRACASSAPPTAAMPRSRVRRSRQTLYNASVSIAGISRSRGIPQAGASALWRGLGGVRVLAQGQIGDPDK